MFKPHKPKWWETWWPFLMVIIAYLIVLIVFVR